MKYKVYFSQICETTVSVEADNYEQAIERAYDAAPSGLSANESGWGEDWSRELNEVMESEAVTDESGAEVWTAGERWTRAAEAQRAEQERDALAAQVQRVRGLHLEGRADGSSWCDHDGFPWPCRTVRALSTPDAEQPEAGQ